MKAYRKEVHWAPSEDGSVKLLVFRPVRRAKPREETPGVLWIHGGGYTLGRAEMIYISRAMALVKRYGAVVVTPEYRLAGKAPYPAALKDCYAALQYLRAHTEEWGIHSGKLMIGGESAGGGLAAALCMYARDRGEIAVAFQMPLYPMLDDRDTESSRDNHAPVWNTRRNHRGWKAYLGKRWGLDVSPYAAPARQTNFAGLPPAYTFVGDIEPFYCETLAFVRQLRQAGVPARVDVYPNGFHGFDLLLPFWRVSRRAIRAFEKAFTYAVEHYTAAQPSRMASGGEQEPIWNREAKSRDGYSGLSGREASDFIE